MTALWADIQNEVGRQLASLGARIMPAGAASAGKIKLRLDPTDPSDADELYGLLLPFMPNPGDDAVVITVGGKNFVLGTNGNSAGPRLYMHSGSPEGAVAASPGSLYLRPDGVGATLLYLKLAGTGSTGWIELSRSARRKTRKEYQADPGATTFSRIGYPADILTGGTLSNVDSGTGNWIQAASPATINTIGYIQAGNGCLTRFELAPDVSIAMRSPASTSSGRWWYGAFAGDPTTLDDPSSVSGFGFRYSPNAGDTTYQAYSNDGSGGGTITNTGISATGTGIAQELRCICDGSGVTFLIDGVPVARHTTNLPAGSTNLRPMATATSLAASTSRAVRVGRITVESEP